jgi:hypothetical protein
MSKPPFDSFRAVRWVRSFNLVLQAVLIVTLFAGLNYVAKNHAWRFDLTKQRKFSLSPETLSYVKNLDRPVHIILTLSPESDNPEVRGLIDEYVYATEGRAAGKITKELLDVYQNRRRAEEVGVELADVIVMLSGDKRRIMPVSDLYTLKNKEREAFNGEQLLTGGILDVAVPNRKKIYFVAGHGELGLDNADAHAGLTTLRGQLKVRNFELDAVNLTATRKVPPDAALLVAVNPQSAYTRQEQELLREYLGANAGRMILFLGPGMSTAALGLEDLLLDWGILVHNDWIVDPGAENMAENGDLLVRAFLPHPVTQTLLDQGQGSLFLRVSAARTVMPDPGRTLGSGLNTVTLAATSPAAWGERAYKTRQVRYDPGVDTRPIAGMEPADRLGVIVASERLAVRDNLPFSVPGGKVVVFGSGDMVANGRLDTASMLLMLNAINWTVDRDQQLSIPPRPIEKFYVSLSTADFVRLRYALLLVLPGSALLLGLLVYWTRRA